MLKNIHTIIICVIILFTGNSLSAQPPELNKSIKEYADSVIGTQVGRGECWDLAAQALNQHNAKWDGQYKYGKPLDPEQDTIYAGDIIQFKNVKLEYNKGMQIIKESMKKHTAIVYEVLSKGVYRIAHQNTTLGGKKVIITTFAINTMKRGKLYFYRPVKA